MVRLRYGQVQGTVAVRTGTGYCFGTDRYRVRLRYGQVQGTVHYGRRILSEALSGVGTNTFNPF